MVGLKLPPFARRHLTFSCDQPAVLVGHAFTCCWTFIPIKTLLTFSWTLLTPSKCACHTTQRETLTWSDQCQSIKTRSNLDIRRMNKGTLIIPSQLKLVKMFRKVCSNQPQHANILKRSTNIRPNSPKNLENLPESILNCWSE